MRTHIDTHRVVHEVVIERDWKVEYFKKCHPWPNGWVLRTEQVMEDDARPVTCVQCLGQR